MSDKQASATSRPRGIVEGFFGPPWSHSSRMNMIEFMSRSGFNSYIYAPKDDPWHRELWREDYPKQQASRLARLISHCGSLGVDFCWALSPGLSIKYSSPAHFKELLGKMLSVANLGVKTFALFLDDIPEEIQNAADKKKYPSLAHAHADLANKLNAEISLARPGSSLIFCPTAYFGAEPVPYTLTLGERLHPSIGVFWTGPQVVSPSITAAHVRQITKTLRRKPLLWDNYPVNDYNRSTLNIGPLRGRDPKLPSLLAGYYSNPMNEAQASRIPLLTISSWLNDPKGYDPEKAFKTAVAQTCGPAAVKPMKTLAEYCGADVLDGQPRPAPDESLNSVLSGGSPAKLLREINRLENIHSELKASVKDKKLLADLAPQARRLERTAKALNLALQARGASPGERNKILKKLIPLARTLRARHRFISNAIAVQELIFLLIKEIDPNTTIENWTQNELFVKGIMN